MFSGWMIDAQDRAKLMRQFPPLFEVEVVSHVTQSVSRDSKVEFPIDAKIVIYDMIVADGMQIALVSVNGKTTRPDGETYHITWSHKKDLAPKQAKDRINKCHTHLSLASFTGLGCINDGNQYLITPLTDGNFSLLELSYHRLNCPSASF